MYELSEQQIQVVQQDLTKRVFLRGAAGTGKTTAGVERMNFLFKNGIPGNAILLLSPHRNLATPYISAYYDNPLAQGGQMYQATIGGLARRMVDLFWPQISDQAGFSGSPNRPIFLTMETTQYYMAKIVHPLLDEGYFNSITIERNRLYSQIVDNLNKAAVVGFDHTEISERLKAAWTGDPVMLRVYDDAQHCANLFRNFCLEHNLLDFSLQIETFINFIWPLEQCQSYMFSTFRHIIVDNVEEDASVSHEFIAGLLENCASSLIIYDEDAGYRRFLGANPETALSLANHCDDVVQFNQTFVMSPSVFNFAENLGDKLYRGRRTSIRETRQNDFGTAHAFALNKFFPDLITWVCNQIVALVNEQNVNPGEIAILSPFLSDSLRFSLISGLTEVGIIARTHRPSRALRDEPETQCLLTLAKLAHPGWGTINPTLQPNQFDVAYALMKLIDNLDLVRAQILTSIVYRPRDGDIPFSSFDRIKPEMQERISYKIGEKYEYFRAWLVQYQTNPVNELDHFISRIFGEVLSQPGFGFYSNFQAGEITANLIESIQKFRWAAAGESFTDNKPPGLEYIEMIQEGVIAAQYLRSWESWSDEAVLVAPAYTFLMYNQPVDYQFWIDPGSRGWSERLYQPLTQPYILSQNWDKNQVWTDLDEVEVNQDSLYRLVSGLLNRCRKKVFLGVSNYSEQGYEQRGPLLHAYQRILLDQS